MARHRGPVLVDTNVILECHRTASWRALTGGYQVETVDDCVTETQTGLQRRRADQQIDERELRESLTAVHAVSDRKRAELALQVPDIILDRGEAALWAHAVPREDAWLLCGPDKASLRFGIRLGFRERLISLEELLNGAGHRPSRLLKEQYRRSWHEMVVGQFIIADAVRV